MPRRQPVPLVCPFWAVVIEADALAHLDALAAMRGLTREQAVLEGITMWTARAALSELRKRRHQAERINREAEAFDPIGALLARPLEAGESGL